MDKRTYNRIATEAYDRGVRGDCRVAVHDNPHVRALEARQWEVGSGVRSAKRGYVQASDCAGPEWQSIARRTTKQETK